MDKKPLTLALLFFLLFAISSCHEDMPNHDLTLINKTRDSFYYYINAFNSVKDSIDNMAYERVTDLSTNKTTYEITGYTLKPEEIGHPSRMNSSWKNFAIKNKGITILLFEKGIEKLPHDKPLTKENIFRRIDLTAKQLDSCKYIITLKD